MPSLTSVTCGDLPHLSHWREALLCASPPGCIPGTTCQWPGHMAFPIELQEIGKTCSGCTDRSEKKTRWMRESKVVYTWKVFLFLLHFHTFSTCVTDYFMMQNKYFITPTPKIQNNADLSYVTSCSHKYTKYIYKFTYTYKEHVQGFV